MRIFIVNTLPVPSGNASVNRLLSYSKELANNKNDVTVLSSGISDEKEGEIYGVKFRNYGFKGHINALVAILSAIRHERPQVTILISNSLLLIYPLWLTCRINGVKLIQEKSEFPFVLMKKGLLNKVWASFYTATTYKLFDGLIVMTKPLMDYFKDKVRKKCKLFEMPMTVDTDRFAIEKTKSEYGDYIAYCGNMAGNKDGVLNLIDSFCIAAPKIPDIKLLLIGGSSNQEDWDKIVSEIQKKGNKNIVLFGKATREEIPALLKNAKALALARPSSLQSTGGFPTKLGEYLATGNPAIVTAVGDIPHYLNDTNAFVIPPDNNDLFAEAMVKVFTDYNNAVAIGREGLKLAHTAFSSKTQSERLYNFLKSV